MEIMKSSERSKLINLNGDWVFFWDGSPAARMKAHRNAFHGENCYVEFQFLKTGFPAGDLFSLLRSQVGSPLQVMSPPSSPIVPTLLEGGFQCRRRCYEMEVTPSHLVEPAEECGSLMFCEKGSEAYAACCKAMYIYYGKTHQAVSPLTASEAAFAGRLPKNAVYQARNGKILHFAFVEENEIAYVGTEAPEAFPDFARDLLARQFRLFDRLCFECDTCDTAAVSLKSLFDAEPIGILDTYIFP